MPVPRNVESEIRTWIERYGLLRIERVPGASGARFELCSASVSALADALAHESVRKLVTVDAGGHAWLEEHQRGSIKQTLIKLGYPVDDRGGYLQGDPCEVRLRASTRGRGGPS